MSQEVTTPTVDALRLTYDAVEFRPTATSDYLEQEAETDAGGSCCCCCCCGTGEEVA
jgi:hypothetical protein